MPFTSLLSPFIEASSAFNDFQRLESMDDLWKRGIMTSMVLLHIVGVSFQDGSLLHVHSSWLKIHLNTHFLQPLLAKKTLQCLEAIHLSQSGALLTLLIDKFLASHHLAVARYCDSIACRRVEMLLTESTGLHVSTPLPISSPEMNEWLDISNFIQQEGRCQLPLEDLEKLLQFMRKQDLLKRWRLLLCCGCILMVVNGFDLGPYVHFSRHARLASLLNKLRNVVCPESLLTLSPAKTHPLALPVTDCADFSLNKVCWLQIMCIIRE